MLKTKKEKKEFVSRVLMKYLNLEEDITKEKDEYNFFYELFKLREYKNDMDKIIISHNPYNYNTYHTEILFTNGYKEPISFKKIIDEQGKDKDKLKEQKYRLNLSECMRKAIKDQIIEFRNNNELKCKNPNCDYKDNEYHVDHIIKFKDLQDNFFNKYKDLEIKKNIINDFEFGGTKFNEESKIYRKWRKYHKKHCELRILCASCNFKLGYKKTF